MARPKKIVVEKSTTKTVRYGVVGSPETLAPKPIHVKQHQRVEQKSSPLGFLRRKKRPPADTDPNVLLESLPGSD